jgi:hypothetical protein
MLVALLAATALLLAWVTPAGAALVHPFQSQLTGPGPGHKPETFSKNACGVYVDPGTQEAYVSDAAISPVVDLFTSAGTFTSQIKIKTEEGEPCSTAVNDTTHNVYVAESLEDVVRVFENAGGKFKELKKLNLDGSNTPAKSFKAPDNLGVPSSSQPLHVAVAQKSQAIYVAQPEQAPSKEGAIDRFNPNSEYEKQLSLPPGTHPQAITTDSSDNLYAILAEEIGSTSIVEFNSSGTLIKQIAEPARGFFGTLTGIAVDSAGHIYVSDALNRVINEFDGAGAFMGQMTGAGSPSGSFVQPSGVAVNGSGQVYVSDRTEGLIETPSVVDIFGPAVAEAPPFLLSESVSDVTSSGATLEAEIDPTGLATRYRFEYGTTAAYGTSAPSPEGDAGSGDSIKRVSVHVDLSAGTEYHFRAVVTNSHGTEMGPDRVFTTQPAGGGFALSDNRNWELVSPVMKEGTLIRGIGANQDAIEQASKDGNAMSYAASTPISGGAAGSPFHTQVLSRRGAEAWSSQGISLPDFEATKIGLQEGAEYRLFSPDLSSALVQAFRAEPPLSPAASERTAYLRDNNKAPCDITKLETTCYVPLVTTKPGFANVPEGVKIEGSPESQSFGEVHVVGATPDLSHTVIRSNVALKSGPEAVEGGVYTWTAGKPADQLHLVSVLPNGNPIGKAHLGHFLKAVAAENVRNAISSDGARVFWSTDPTGKAEGVHEHLYVRDMTAGTTVQVDAAQGVAEPAEGEAVFQTASEDGSKVFFTDGQKLTTDSTAGGPERPDLYAYDVTNKELTDLTVDHNALESATVAGAVLGASTDGSYVYFVANGVLTTAESAQKDKASPGQCTNHPPANATCNLYLEHFTGGKWETTFIAKLSADDAPDWAARGIEQPGRGRESLNANILLIKLTARVSPNGEHLVFMSDRPLTGYNNTDAMSGRPDQEVFQFSAAPSPVGTLVCASCNPNGAKPTGMFDTGKTSPTVPLIDRQENWPGQWLAANIPGWTAVYSGSSLYQSRYLSDSGRMFFNSADALVPQDTNGKQDVYEFEPAGVGTCTPASVTFSIRSGGCVSLISSGTSDQESAFVDASENGGHVFFLTAAPLVRPDVGASFDIYDAHDCSESPCLAPPPPSTPPCGSGDACKPAPTAPPGFGPPASSTFSGPGNITPPQQTVLGATTHKLTTAQQLAKALKACKKLPKKKRAACEAKARKKYKVKKASAKKAGQSAPVRTRR